MPELTDFELRNAATGPDPFVLSEYAADADRNAVVLLFLRDYHCTKCKSQMESVASRYDDFETADADVVGILPEPIENTRDWNENLDLPFPLLADDSTTVSDQYDQPTRFGALGSLHDLIGRMPEAVVIDATGTEPTITHVDKGTTPGDRPTVDELLQQVRAVGSVEA